jgi:hypothetical protein
MSKQNLEALSERERACLAHLEEAKRLGINFSQYCREHDLRVHHWSRAKRDLIRKGMLSAGRLGLRSKGGAFLPVRIAPVATLPATASIPACRIRHPSGWAIECVSLPEVSWLSALVTGEAS